MADLLELNIEKVQGMRTALTLEVRIGSLQRTIALDDTGLREVDSEVTSRNLGMTTTARSSLSTKWHPRFAEEAPAISIWPSSMVFKICIQRLI